MALLLGTSWAHADDDSSVYLCSLENSPSDEYVVRMKKYYDPFQKMDMGKVDRLNNAEVLESIPTKVIEVPLMDQETYVQIWLGDQVTLDAQLSYNQGHRAFHAIYKKKTEKLDLVCQETQD